MTDAQVERMTVAFEKHWRSSGQTGESFTDAVRNGMRAAIAAMPDAPPLEDVLREIWAAHQWIVNDLMPVDGTWAAEIVSIPEYGVVAYGAGGSPFAAIRAAVANAQEGE